jgi:hypothetical protein
MSELHYSSVVLISKISSKILLSLFITLQPQTLFFDAKQTTVVYNS